VILFFFGHHRRGRFRLAVRCVHCTVVPCIGAVLLWHLPVSIIGHLVVGHVTQVARATPAHTSGPPNISHSITAALTLVSGVHRVPLDAEV